MRIVFALSHLQFSFTLRLTKGKCRGRTNVQQAWDLHGKYCNGMKAELTFIWCSCWVIQGHRPLAALSSDTFERSPGWMTVGQEWPSSIPFLLFFIVIRLSGATMCQSDIVWQLHQIHRSTGVCEEKDVLHSTLSTCLRDCMGFLVLFFNLSLSLPV